MIWTEETRPSSITMCGLSGGIERWLIIRFDTTEPPVTYISQAVAALRQKLNHAADGRKYVTFFGQAFGFIVSYSPDEAVRCDLDGLPLEALPKAYRPGEVTLSFGGKAVSPTVTSRISWDSPMTIILVPGPRGHSASRILDQDEVTTDALLALFRCAFLTASRTASISRSGSRWTPSSG